MKILLFEIYNYLQNRSLYLRLNYSILFSTSYLQTFMGHVRIRIQKVEFYLQICSATATCVTYKFIIC